jgi:hypothetical protein
LDLVFVFTSFELCVLSSLKMFTLMRAGLTRER